MQLLCRRFQLVVADARAVLEGRSIVGEREMLDFCQKRLQIGRLVGQLVMVPGRCGKAGQTQYIRLVIARVVLRPVDGIAVIQDLRQQDDAVEVDALSSRSALAIIAERVVP